MTRLLIVCKDCRREVWMTPREYISWRCPVCNGYPAVRASRWDDTAACGGGPLRSHEALIDSCSSLKDTEAGAVEGAVCPAAG